MTFDYPDPGEREELHAEDLFVADLLGEYVQRHDQRATVTLDDLLARATSFSPGAARKLRTVAAFYDTAHTQGR